MAKRLPKDVQAALDKLEPMLAEAITAAFQNMIDAVALQQVEDAIRAGDIEAVIETLRITGEWFTPVNEALRAALLEGGSIAVATMRIRDPFDGTRFVMGFDGRHERAENWLRNRSSELITEVIEDQKAMARSVLRDAMEVGRHPRQTALDIVGRVNRATGKREGAFIGLTEQQGQWVKNAETQLRDLDRGYFSRTRRDKRYDGIVARAIKDDKPLAEADIRRIVARYKDRMLKTRADAIARTESLNALRAGRHEGFQQLVDSGKVRADQVVITWSATMDTRTRDTHRHLNGQAVQFGQFFNPAPGVFMQYPGDLEHSPGNAKGLAANTIQCRCYAEYRVRRDGLRYEDG